MHGTTNIKLLVNIFEVQTYYIQRHSYNSLVFCWRTQCTFWYLLRWATGVVFCYVS